MITGRGWNLSLFQLVGVGPKWTFQCHKCGRGWKQRLIEGVNNPLITCPNCNYNQRINAEWE